MGRFTDGSYVTWVAKCDTFSAPLRGSLNRSVVVKIYLAFVGRRLDVSSANEVTDDCPAVMDKVRL